MQRRLDLAYKRAMGEGLQNQQHQNQDGNMNAVNQMP